MQAFRTTTTARPAGHDAPRDARARDHARARRGRGHTRNTGHSHLRVAQLGPQGLGANMRAKAVYRPHEKPIPLSWCPHCRRNSSTCWNLRRPKRERRQRLREQPRGGQAARCIECAHRSDAAVGWKNHQWYAKGVGAKQSSEEIARHLQYGFSDARCKVASMKGAIIRSAAVATGLCDQRG